MTETEREADLPPQEYMPEPQYPDGQEVEEFAPTLVARFAGLPQAPRDWRETLDWAAGQISRRDRNWAGLCQMFTRTASGCPGGFASAFAQWVGMPAGARHPGGSPDEAPIGARIYTKGDNPFGHVMIVARPFADGTHACISTDARRLGWPDRVSTVGLIQAWGHEYLGWGENQNGLWTDIKDAKPQQTEQYEAIAAARDRIGNAVDDLRTARETAKDQKDWKDRDRITKEIEHLRAQKRALNDLYETLRRLP